MNGILDVGRNAWVGYWRYFGDALVNHGWGNYLTLLLVLSAGVWLWELWRPWRPQQPRIREGFFLDAFYMVFNFFGFSLLGYAAVDAMVRHGVGAVLGNLGIGLELVDAREWPMALKFLSFFVLRDFVHYWVHRSLHQ